jgi:hypothetical protein
MTQILSFVQRIPPQVIGTGIAFFSVGIPDGQKEMVLGKYFALQKERPTSFINSLTVVYGGAKIEMISQNPRAIWLLGHMIDLSHKVLAAASLYFTFTAPPLSYFVKTAQISLPILQKAYPIIFLTPITLKLVHMVFDYPGMTPTLRPLCDKVHRLAQRVESFFYYSPIYLVGPWWLFEAAHNDSQPLVCMRDVALFLLTTLIRLAAWWNSSRQPPPRALETLESQFEAIGWSLGESMGTIPELEIRMKAVKPAFEELKKEQLVSLESIWGQVWPFIRPYLNKFLANQVYTPLTNKDFTLLAHEASLRRMFSAQGLVNSINDPQTRGQEYYLFANMLLCANLFRLVTEKKDLPPEQLKLIQHMLCYQAVSARGCDPLLPYMANSTDFNLLRQMFGTTVVDCKLSSSVLVAYLNLIAKAIGAKTIAYPSDDKLPIELLGSLTTKFVKGDVTQLIDTLPSQELKDLAKKTDATLDEICEAVRKASNLMIKREEICTR